MKKIYLLFIGLMFIQAACADVASPTVPAIPVNTVAPTNTVLPVNSSDSCPMETSEFKLMMNALDGYCVLYPASFALIPPNFVVVNPNAVQGGDSLGDSWVMITVEESAGRTAAQVSDELIAAAGSGFVIQRTDFLVDGDKQAVMLDGLPGPDSLRRVTVVNDERLYTFVFMPWTATPDGADQPTPVEYLYTTMMNSIHFIPRVK